MKFHLSTYQNNYSKIIKYSALVILIFILSFNANSEIPEKYKIESSLSNCKGTDYRKWNNCYGEYKFPRIEYKGEWKNGTMYGKGVLKEAWGDIYFGDFENNLAHGYGRQDFYSDGYYSGYFEGSIKKDFLEGKGKQVVFDDFEYEGNFKLSYYDGYGVLTWVDGSKYEGNFKKNLRHGKGKQYYADGGIYEGNFSEDFRNGEGKIFYESGESYEGEWKDDFRNGFGSYTWPDGDRYVGYFIKDEFAGKGMFKDDSDYFYEGEFIGSQFDGKGKIEWINGETYEGDFKDGYRTGKGKYTYESGTVHEGDIVKNIFSGNGIIKYADGGIYKGGVDNDIEEGIGEYTSPEGDFYKGQFSRGYFHGKGKMIYANGDIYDGLWDDGLKLEGKTTLAKFETNEKYFALIIGNNNYEKLQKLDNAVNDAIDLEKVLSEKYGFKTTLLLDKKADEIEDEIIKFTDNRKRNENLLIYYAGHGQLIKKQKLQRGYWLPIDAGESRDANWISNNDIKDSIASSNAKHILLIVDSCFSGSLMRGSGDNKSVEKLTQRHLDRLKIKTTRLVITSGGNEYVVDGIGEAKNSVFAEPLIKALNNNNDVIRSIELFQRVQKYVVENAEQTPDHSAIHGTGHDGGEFLFFPKS